MNRRQFIQTGLVAPLVAAMPSISNSSRPPRILLRSAWQTVNIGDIAHAPGLLALLETHLPDAEIRLWANRLDQGVDDVYRARFPRLRILDGEKDVEAAFAECDFLLHGSGANLVAERHVRRWHEETGKPFGVFGITFGRRSSSRTHDTSPDMLAATTALLSKAAFVYFRDRESLAFAKAQGCDSPVTDFGPDAAFACDLRDDARADAFLEQHDLRDGEFVCCIPRLRYSPYWVIPSKNRELEPDKHARNEAMKEHDHAPLRQAISEIVARTDMKVLICPEDMTQMAVGKEMLFDKLPDAVRERVVWRPDYWLTGEAISTYVRSAGMFANDLHSPIMCIGHGVPAIVCRWAEQTSKGTMWKDIGLEDWLFDLDDEAQVERVAPAVMRMVTQPEASREKAAAARDVVAKRHAEGMGTLKRALSA